MSSADKDREKAGYLVTPRIDEAATLAQSAEMADRFNRLFLRTLRVLRDLRRYAPPMTIQNLGGQVDVAGQQVVANGAEPMAIEAPPKSCGLDAPRYAQVDELRDMAADANKNSSTIGAGEQNHVGPRSDAAHPPSNVNLR